MPLNWLVTGLGGVVEVTGGVVEVTGGVVDVIGGVVEVIGGVVDVTGGVVTSPAVQLTVTGPESPLATKPNEVDAPAPRPPLYVAFATVTVPELPVAVPFHSDCRVAPDGSAMETVQLVMAPLPACTVTVPWKPPGHPSVDA